MFTARSPILLAGAAVTLAACGASSASSPAPSIVARAAPDCPPSASARIRPADFTGRVTNPWFPLVPGAVYRYRGTEGRQRTHERIVVTHRVKRILGVRNVVVDDRLYRSGHLAEKTLDYYTQDRRGRVWYFGEDTATLSRSGHVISRDGSFRAGRDGARPGIFMPAHPKVGQCFHQERYAGHAEDTFRITSLRGRTLKTTERTVLEPGVVDGKRYVRGIGTVLERTLRSPDPKETLRLISYRKG